jgi:ubiquinone/menaquinone biosynthesis C-methylase UbiE
LQPNKSKSSQVNGYWKGAVKLMHQHEMVNLIRAGIAEPGGIWADLGAGTGNFSWALAKLLGKEATIHTLDRDSRAITAQQQRIKTDPPGATILPRQADVLRPINLPVLDGVLMANLLHFMRDQPIFLQQVRKLLKPTGRLLVVEYEQRFPIPWVPFPVPFARLSALAETTGFTLPLQIGNRRSPSSGQEMYAAVLAYAA